MYFTYCRSASFRLNARARRNSTHFRHECIKENYEFCKQCKGSWGIESDCQNVTECNKTTGKGEKSQNYISTDPLANCVIPRTRKVDCSIINYPSCTCRYDISSNKNCNDNNTICIGNTSVCTLNYTKIDEIKGGVCPNPNNIFNILGDQRCKCTVERTFGNWNYINERCNSTTYSADRSRKITVKKTGGLKGCTFLKQKNPADLHWDRRGLDSQNPGERGSKLSRMMFKFT